MKNVHVISVFAKTGQGIESQAGESLGHSQRSKVRNSYMGHLIWGTSCHSQRSKFGKGHSGVYPAGEFTDVRGQIRSWGSSVSIVSDYRPVDRCSILSRDKRSYRNSVIK
jgi:hypothetical protein